MVLWILYILPEVQYVCLSLSENKLNSTAHVDAYAKIATLHAWKINHCVQGILKNIVKHSAVQMGTSLKILVDIQMKNTILA